MTKLFNRESEKGKRRNLRSQMPPAEAFMWSRIQNRQILDCKFRRQFSVGPYILDFYSPEIKLGIELDGDSHFMPGAQEADSKRQRFIESFGIRIVRYGNPEVLGNIDGVLESIEEAISVQRRQGVGNHGRGETEE